MTAQAKDTLIFKQKEYRIATEPLKDYLKNIELPHPLVMPHTACSRGYYADWAIANKKLFLVDFCGFLHNSMRVGMDYLFPDETFVFAEWFSGEIRIPLGDLLIYYHSGYSSIHEGDMFLTFENGVLLKKRSKWRTPEEIEKLIREDEESGFK